MMKKLTSILILVLAVGLTGCAEWSDEYDFRNYLRDKHPYSELIELDLGSSWMYQVNDTINGEIWIYTSSRSESSVESHCVTCPIEDEDVY
jgi:hypothetical protein